ncbi:TnsA endonuclease N-terminal domain-containing protein [Rhizobium beringeri]|uniref:hypothetical protein n=1 Tax=Rhizobium beringeri TaxID=3019934 RepID=UPI002E0D9214|nr:TnsA endonuclease N-terminal domain-containing protein [Rhizobium beringeri]
MLERRVLDYLTCKERGTVRAIPDSFEFARADRPAAGRLIVPGVTPDDHPGLTFEEAGDRTDVAWQPPRASTASREISLKSASSIRGHLVDISRNRLLSFESILEYLMANIVMADKNIILVEDQPAELPFDLDGNPHRHTIDFRTTSSSRIRVAYAVKPEDQLKRDQTVRKMQALASLHAPTFADKFIVCTEAKITRDYGWNAVDVNEARAVRSQAYCDHVLEVLLGIGRPIEIWRLQEQLGDESDVWNAVLCLLFDRLIQIEEPRRRFSDASVILPLIRH